MNHQRLLHPHVVQLKEVFAAQPFLALVMEFVPNGDMFQVGAELVGCCWRVAPLRVGCRGCWQVACGVAGHGVGAEWREACSSELLGAGRPGGLLV